LVDVTVLDPVSTEGMNLEGDLEKLTDDVRDRMLKTYKEES
jgi:hypothetical protein